MAEAHGLGICYLGTTIYTAEEIARILDLPKGVIPVTTIVVGHPDESPELTDRLPLDAVVHCEKYHHYTSSEIDELWAEKETSEETRRTACRIWHRFSRATGIVPKITWLFRATISRC